MRLPSKKFVDKNINKSPPTNGGQEVSLLAFLFTLFLVPWQGIFLLYLVVCRQWQQLFLNAVQHYNAACVRWSKSSRVCELSIAKLKSK